MAASYVSFSLLLCGFYVRVADMRLSIMKGLTWVSFSKYTLEALAHNELQNRVWDTASCDEQFPSEPWRTLPFACSTSSSLPWKPQASQDIMGSGLHPADDGFCAGHCNPCCSCSPTAAAPDRGSREAKTSCTVAAVDPGES